jgi:hypothetical protein
MSIQYILKGQVLIRQIELEPMPTITTAKVISRRSLQKRHCKPWRASGEAVANLLQALSNPAAGRTGQNLEFSDFRNNRASTSPIYLISYVGIEPPITPFN